MAAESDVASALFGRLAQYTAHPIALPDTSFTKPANFRYLEPKFVPNSSDRIIDGPHRLFGLLQVNVHWTKLRGEIEPRKAAENVAALFPCDAKIPGAGFRVRIPEKPDIRDIIISNEMPDVVVPVMIQWEETRA